MEGIARSVPAVWCGLASLVLLVISVVGTCHQAHAQQPGLVAAWDFEDVRGNRVPDVSQRGHDGTAHGARWFKGRFGTALWVEDGQGMVEVADAADLQLSDPLTLEAWVCPLALRHAQKVLSKGGPSDDGYWLDLVESDSFSASVGGARVYARNSIVQAQHWYHVAVTLEKGTLRIFVDGELGGEKKLPRRPPSPSLGPLYLGVHRGPGAYPWNGLIDEVRIYNRALSVEEMAARYHSGVARHGATLTAPGVRPWLLRTVVRAAEESEIPVVLMNETDRQQSGACKWQLADADHRVVAQGASRRLSVSAQGEARFSITLPALAPGEYVLKTWWGDTRPQLSGDKILALARREPGPVQEEVSVERRLVDEIDCTRDYGPERYTSLPGTRVVNSRVGTYREAGPDPRDRFAYRINIGTVNRPHLLVFEYPDDKKRSFGVLDGTTMDLSGGVITGGVLPLTNTFHTQEILFWPRDRDQAVIFMTWAPGLPAAVRSIRVYEIVGPLPVQAIDEPQEGLRRYVGAQWEDPSVEVSFGAFRIPEATLSDWDNYGAYEHMAQYLAYTGQNLYKYPISWYLGPHYPSRFFASYRQGSRGDPDWAQAMLLMFQDYGISFIPSLTLLRLPTLMQRDRMVYDEQAVRAGMPTYNMCLADGGVRGTTNDWTAGTDPTDAAVHPSGPLFDPVHPVVRGEIRRLFQEILERYADYPNFKGISVNMWPTTILWFHSLQDGYGDQDIAQFEADTGIHVPVSASDPDRFHRRYQWLIEHHREEWITWRCTQIHDFLTELRDMMVARRKDLRLQISCWPWYLRSEGRLRPRPEDQLGLGASAYTQYREGGLDWKMFLDEPNMDLELQMTPQHQRFAEGAETYPESMMFRDLDFLDEETLCCFRHAAGNACWLYNAYFETFQVASPLPGWWFGGEWLNHPGLLLGHKYFMEHYAQAVAALDARFITRGGLGMGTIGHDADVRRFARAVRALPSAPFSDVPTSADTVVARHWRGEKRYYIELVNREFVPTTVTLEFAARPTGLSDLAAGTPIATTGSSVSVTIGAYGVMALGLPADGPRLLRVGVEVPRPVVEWVGANLQAFRDAVAATPAASPERADGQRLLGSLEAAVAAQQYFAADHLLGSYACQKILAEAGAEQGHE